MQRFGHGASSGDLSLSVLTKPVGFSRSLSELLTKVSDSHEACRKRRRGDCPATARDVACS